MATLSPVYLFKAVKNMVLRIFKMIATSGFLTALECTEFVFGWGSAPDRRWENLLRSPDSLAGLRGHTSKGEWERWERGRRRARGEKRKGGPAPYANSWIRPCCTQHNRTTLS